MQHPAHVVILRRNAGVAPGVEEELQIPHQAAERREQHVGDNQRFCDREVGFYRQVFHFCQTNDAVAQVNQRAAAHDHHVAWQRHVQRVNAQRGGGLMHRFGGVHRKRHPGGENPAHHRQHQPLLQIEVFGLDAHFALFQLARTGHNTDADHRHQHAQQRHAPAFGVDQHVEVAVEDRRHQGADNQRNANRDADPHRHAEIAHGQTVVDVTDAPHRAKQKDRQQGGGAKGGEIAPEIGEQHGADGPGQNQPRHRTAHGPHGFP